MPLDGFIGLRCIGMSFYLVELTGLQVVGDIPYFRDQTPHSISGRPRIIAAPPEGLDEINAALD